MPGSCLNNHHTTFILLLKKKKQWNSSTFQPLSHSCSSSLERFDCWRDHEQVWRGLVSEESVNKCSSPLMSPLWLILGRYHQLQAELAVSGIIILWAYKSIARLTIAHIVTSLWSSWGKERAVSSNHCVRWKYFYPSRRKLIRYNHQLWCFMFGHDTWVCSCNCLFREVGGGWVSDAHECLSCNGHYNRLATVFLIIRIT